MLHGATLVAVICRDIVGLTFACTLADQRTDARQSVLNENCSGYKDRRIIWYYFSNVRQSGLIMIYVTAQVLPSHFHF